MDKSVHYFDWLVDRLVCDVKQYSKKKKCLLQLHSVKDDVFRCVVMFNRQSKTQR